MPAIAIVQTCQTCGTQFTAKRAQCPSCKAWQLPEGIAAKEKVDPNRVDDIVFLNSVPDADIERYPTGDWDVVFGGSAKPFGLARTSTVLLGGEPGAGKSTLSLQILDAICSHTGQIGMLVGAEESAKEVMARSARLELKRRDLIALMPMGSNSELPEVLLRRRPCCVVLDSLPGFINDPIEGLELAGAMKGYAVELNAPFILVDHINKGGDFAGFIALQHKVDTTIQLSVGDDEIRTLKPIKNRYGPTGDSRAKLLGMTEKGLIVLPDDFYNDGDEDD